MLRLHTKLLFCLLLISHITYGQLDFSAPQILINDASLTLDAGDLDGDGDNDVVAQVATGEKVMRLENLGDGSMGIVEYFDYGFVIVSDISLVDMNQDGLLDLLVGHGYCATAVNKGIMYHKNLGSVADGFIESLPIWMDESSQSSVTVGAFDLNGDEFLEMISYSSGTKDLFVSTGDSCSSYEKTLWGGSATNDFLAEDYDNDGDCDILLLGNSGISWLRNLGNGTLGLLQDVSSFGSGSDELFYEDMDGDGLKEFVSYNDEIIRIEGAGIVGDTIVNLRKAKVLDLDLDGHLDVVALSFTKVYWFENYGDATFVEHVLYETNLPHVMRDFACVDMDGDEDIDIVIGSNQEVIWLESLDFSFSTAINNPPCLGADNGSFSIDINSHFNPPYEYSWSLNDGEQTGQGLSNTEQFTITGLAGGVYDVYLEAATGDTSSVTGIPLPSVAGSFFEIVAIETTNAANDQANGSIHVELNGGMPPFELEWMGVSSGMMGSAVDTFQITELLAGEYELLVTDALGNVQSAIVTVLNESNPTPTCLGPLDIVILNDVSASVNTTEYDQSEEFFIDMFQAFNIGEEAEDSRAAVIEWSSKFDTQLIIPMTGSLESLAGYGSISRASGAGTNPLFALEYGYDYLKTVEREDAIKVLVLSTDAEPTQVSPALTVLADQFKAEGYVIVTIAFD